MSLTERIRAAVAPNPASVTSAQERAELDQAIDAVDVRG